MINNAISRISRAIRITKKASNNFDPRFFIRHRKSIIRKIKSRIFNNTAVFDLQLVIGVGVSDQCNINCVYCFEHSPLQVEIVPGVAAESVSDAKLSLSAFKKLADDLVDLGVDYVQFVGRGEPFLNPNLMDMCAYAKKKGLKFRIASNGTLISDTTAKAIVDLDCEELNISIGAVNPETYHRLTNAGSGTLEKIFQMLSVLVEYRKSKRGVKPRILLTNVINSLNFSEIADMVRKGVEIGVDSVGFHRMYSCKRRLKIVDSLFLSPQHIDLVKKYLIDAMLFAEKNKMETNIPFFLKLLSHEGQRKTMDYIRQAWRMRSCCFVLADGSVIAEDFPETLGNINKESFIKIWYSDKYVHMRRDADLIVEKSRSLPCPVFCRSCNAPLYKNSLINY